MIEINNLVKRYGDFELNISLELPEGRVSGIVGRNGAGKTTALKAILGLIHPDSGSVQTLGKNAEDLTAAEKSLIGTALPESGFSSFLKINDICKILGTMYPCFDENGFTERCITGGLPLDKDLKTFSTGMSAKLKTLIACSHDAKLLILDEPTAGLDVIARNEILDMLRKYLADDSERSMLISSHISSDLEGICDDIYMINDGKVVMHEDTDKLLDQYAVLRLSEEAFNKIDKKYFIKTKKEKFGRSCFTDQKQYYAENFPDAIIEGCSIDEMIIMMNGGES